MTDKESNWDREINYVGYEMYADIGLKILFYCD